MLPVYHLSLPAYDSHHGSVGRGIETKHIDCRHYCSNVIDVWGQVLFNKICFGGTSQPASRRTVYLLLLQVACSCVCCSPIFASWAGRTCMLLGAGCSR